MPSSSRHTNDSSFKEIKSTYRKLVLQFHPDKNMSETDGKQFKMITEAYQFLKTEHKKTYQTSSKNNWKYTSKNSNKEYDFNSNKQSWGARQNDRTLRKTGADTQDKPNPHTKIFGSTMKNFLGVLRKGTIRIQSRTRTNQTKKRSYSFCKRGS